MSRFSFQDLSRKDIVPALYDRIMEAEAKQVRSKPFIPPQLLEKPKKKGNKFGAIKTEIDGIMFDSKGEASYYTKVIKPALENGLISRLEFHPSYPVIINDINVCVIELDFVYIVNATGAARHVDFKGCDTALSKLKRKLLKATYGIDVKLVKSKDIKWGTL